MSNHRMMEHEGYTVVAYDNGDIIIYRKGRFIMQALCSKGMSDEEVLTEVDNMLALRERFNFDGAFV